MSTRQMLMMLLVSISAASSLHAQDVVRCPNQNVSLVERWKWAGREAVKLNNGKEFWVGYSMKRLMSEDSYISSGNLYSGNREARRSIYDVISGDTSRRTTEIGTWRNGERNRLEKVLKDVAILARISGGLEEEGSLKKLELCNMELHADLFNKPLLWLGSADDDQSVSVLKGMFDRQSSPELKKALLTAIGVHQNSEAVFPFLAGVLKREQAENVRSQTTFWLGQQNRPECLPVLVDAAQTDRSGKVKEQSVFAISQLTSDESLDALIGLARTANDTKVRGKAAFWLGQRASQRAVSTLESIIADDEESDVQRQALYGLAQIHTPEGVERLIKIARTHSNPRIRKQAIQCLGQSDDPRALDALIAIVKN